MKVTKELVRTEFDVNKIFAGDVVSYIADYPSPFSKVKRELRHGIVTKVERDWISIVGSDFDEFSMDLGIHSNDAEYKELRVVIQGLRK